MTFDPTKPVQTRDGRKARIICTNANNKRNIIALVIFENGKEYPIGYNSEGKSVIGIDLGESDLINIPDRKVLWANIYNGYLQNGMGSRKEADFCAEENRLGVLKLIYENDELVDHEYEKLK